LIVFANGKEVARRVGLTSDEGVRKLLAAGAAMPSASIELTRTAV
jgi:hypothetical protein